MCVWSECLLYVKQRLSYSLARINPPVPTVNILQTPNFCLTPCRVCAFAIARNVSRRPSQKGKSFFLFYLHVFVAFIVDFHPIDSTCVFVFVSVGHAIMPQSNANKMKKRIACRGLETVGTCVCSLLLLLMLLLLFAGLWIRKLASGKAPSPICIHCHTQIHTKILP